MDSKNVRFPAPAARLATLVLLGVPAFVAAQTPPVPGAPTPLPGASVPASIPLPGASLPAPVPLPGEAPAASMPASRAVSAPATSHQPLASPPPMAAPVQPPPPRPPAAAPVARALPPAPPPAPVRGLPPDAPKLVITGGVYSGDPAVRRLIVNGNVVAEGATVAPGVTLEQIKPGGAVLAYRGHRYDLMY